MTVWFSSSIGNGDIPVVILSADATKRAPGPLLEAGARAYLTKPIGVRELLEVVDTYMGGLGLRPRRCPHPASAVAYS